MAKDRKLRRAERELQHQRVLAERARQAEQRRRRQAFVRRVTFYELRRRSTGTLLVRRSRGQRALIAVTGGLGLVLIWQLVPSVEMRIALTAVLVLALPVLVIIAFDKRST